MTYAGMPDFERRRITESSLRRQLRMVGQQADDSIKLASIRKLCERDPNEVVPTDFEGNPMPHMVSADAILAILDWKGLGLWQ